MLDELIYPLLQNQKSRKLAVITISVLVFFIMYTLITSFINWGRDFKLAQTKFVPSANDKAFEDTSHYITELPERHLFGVANEEETDFLPITSLQLHLTGILASPDGSIAHAIISEAGNNGKIYSIGDELTQGIIIKSINSHGVVLERNGHLEKLPLTRNPLVFHDTPPPLLEFNQ